MSLFSQFLPTNNKNTAFRLASSQPPNTLTRACVIHQWKTRWLNSRLFTVDTMNRRTFTTNEPYSWQNNTRESFTWRELKNTRLSLGENLFCLVWDMVVVELVVVGTFTALTLLDAYMLKKLCEGKVYRVHVNSKYHLAGDGSYLL